MAFANTKGGTIYIGVSDSGEIIGINNVDFVMQQLSNSIRDSIKPDIVMFTSVELLEYEDKSYLKIMVNQGTKKPYYLSDKGIKPSGVYVRSGSTSSPATEDSIRMMIKTTDGDSFEKNRSMLQELSFNSLCEELKKGTLILQRAKWKI